VVYEQRKQAVTDEEVRIKGLELSADSEKVKEFELAKGELFYMQRALDVLKAQFTIAIGSAAIEGAISRPIDADE
jgi:hypothetical protein